MRGEQEPLLPRASASAVVARSQTPASSFASYANDNLVDDVFFEMLSYLPFNLQLAACIAFQRYNVSMEYDFFRNLELPAVVAPLLKLPVRFPFLEKLFICARENRFYRAHADIIVLRENKEKSYDEKENDGDRIFQSLLNNVPQKQRFFNKHFIFWGVAFFVYLVGMSVSFYYFFHTLFLKGDAWRLGLGFNGTVPDIINNNKMNAVNGISTSTCDQIIMHDPFGWDYGNWDVNFFVGTPGNIISGFVQRFFLNCSSGTDACDIALSNASQTLYWQIGNLFMNACAMARNGSLSCVNNVAQVLYANVTAAVPGDLVWPNYFELQSVMNSLNATIACSADVSMGSFQFGLFAIAFCTTLFMLSALSFAAVESKIRYAPAMSDRNELEDVHPYLLARFKYGRDRQNRQQGVLPADAVSVPVVTA